MKENDSAFIQRVTDFYYSTVTKETPQGNMSMVAEHFKITRAKVNKILITASAIDSPLHQDIMKLKESGYDTSDIASALGVSESTVKINMPYEKVIYNGETKSAGAQYVKEFRNREKIFLANVVRAKTISEQKREEYLSDPANAAFHEAMIKEGFYERLKEIKDDPVHLSSHFTEEEAELFKIPPNVAVLHMELEADLSDVKDFAQIQYPSIYLNVSAEDTQNNLNDPDNRSNIVPIGKYLVKEKYTISRDILVPDDIPLHNLHYAINQAFGFANEHLHAYTLHKKDLLWITERKVSKWKKYTGLIFKNPVREEDTDFWDDDYEGGSPKKWMRSKYTGPDYDALFEESYLYAQREMKDRKIRAKALDNLWEEFEYNPFELNEALPVGELLNPEGRKEFKDRKNYEDLMKENIREASVYPEESLLSQPFVDPFVSEINYNYDFGDNWNIRIKTMPDVEYLIKAKRLTAEQMREAIKDVCILVRPVVLAADGLPLVENVGGSWGFKDFLKSIHGEENEAFSDKEESLAWARSNGWTGKIGNCKTIL